eukprot:14618900-Alexandrium_andersonii.AAC.1
MLVLSTAPSCFSSSSSSACLADCMSMPSTLPWSPPLLHRVALGEAVVLHAVLGLVVLLGLLGLLLVAAL